METKKTTEIPKDKGGRPKKAPSAKKMLKELVPISSIFTEEEELLYNSLVDIYLKDFDEEELTAGDLDDIMTIAMNKVHELRLLKSAKGDGDRLLDISQTIEKSRKQTEKIKENLSSRRKDRVDPNANKSFSIVDLAVAFDNEKKIKLDKKTEQMKAEEKVARAALDSNPGNKFDKDLDAKDE